MKNENGWPLILVKVAYRDGLGSFSYNFIHLQ